MGRVTVVGSINMDVVTTAARLPRIGETIIGSTVQLLPGGKGANQAIAAARMGAATSMIGSVGADEFGSQMTNFLRAQGVETARIQADPTCATGVAVVIVQAGGDNAILVVPGANQRLAAADVLEELGGPGDVVVGQLEVPEAVVAAAFAAAKRSGVTTVLNAAPAGPVSAELLADSDVLIVNETELATLAGWDELAAEDVELAARQLRRRADAIIVVTLGARGSLVIVDDRAVEIAARATAVVDTTGAGDCFVGALAADLAAGAPVERAILTATAAASLCVGRSGAGVAMPNRTEVDALLGEASPREAHRPNLDPNGTGG